jgi:hypothetical protein
MIAYGTQCRHELALDGCFVLKKWDERWFQAPAVNLPDLKMSFNGKYIMNDDLVGPVRSQNLCILVTCIGVGGLPIPECNQVLAQASIVNGWMNKSKKKYKFVISSLATDTYLQTRESDAMREPDLTQHAQVHTNIK